MCFLRVHEAIAEVCDELLVCGIVVVHGLQGHQPFELLLGPLIDLWSFDTGEGNGDSFNEGGESWDIVVNEEIGGKLSEKALSF